MLLFLLDNPLAQSRQTGRDRIQAERDREVNARTVAAMDFRAREAAVIRIALESKVDKENLDLALTQCSRCWISCPSTSIGWTT